MMMMTNSVGVLCYVSFLIVEKYMEMPCIKGNDKPKRTLRGLRKFSTQKAERRTVGEYKMSCWPLLSSQKSKLRRWKLAEDS